MNKALTLSIVIPVYNEENHLGLCLDSIARQTTKPEEVVVVDNNSTDGTIALAKKYDFVRILHEPAQGLIPARNTGFNAAKSQILGRINADAVLEDNWVETVKYNFNRENISGISGPAVTKLFPGLPWIHSLFWSKVYLLSTKAYFRAPVMWGANMAISKDIWKRIEPMADLEDSYVHEDQDLSLLVAGHGGNILIDNDLKIHTNEQSYFYWPKFREYAVRRWRTKSHHIRIGTYSNIDEISALFSVTVWLLMAVPVALFVMSSFAFFHISQAIKFILN